VHPFAVATMLWPVAFVLVYATIYFSSWIPFTLFLAGLYFVAWREDARRDPRVWYPFHRVVKRQVPSN
jgi:hypothetical protein